ncbi:MAG TPA: formylmethanofuran--tetrahydromethanopterin N-formyltransferase [Alphaproteobacteria bacterium]|nr:formylmethanofuran--tetrahydromethanopterin N-formyltransferase [Alphaproteobacteria bacterium]
MIVNGVVIEDTFAEAFGMRATRLVITADSAAWATRAAESLTGFATSVIGCGCEAGIERLVAPAETPDGRPGVSVLIFAVNSAELAKQVLARVGQSVLTTAGSACYSGLDTPDTIPLGRSLRFFGDGFQASKQILGRRYWRVPVMDGEFLVEDSVGMVRAVGGGNLLILGESRAEVLAASEHAVAAIRRLPNVILPFPGGIVRSGSKVGARYKGLPASTNDAYCPSLKGVVASRLEPGIESVLEIVIDGLTEEDVAAAMRAGILALCEVGAAGGVRRIGAGNYGGKLGPFQFRLREIAS